MKCHTIGHKLYTLQAHIPILWSRKHKLRKPVTKTLPSKKSFEVRMEQMETDGNMEWPLCLARCKTSGWWKPDNWPPRLQPTGRLVALSCKLLPTLNSFDTVPCRLECCSAAVLRVEGIRKKILGPHPIPLKSRVEVRRLRCCLWVPRTDVMEIAQRNRRILSRRKGLSPAPYRALDWQFIFPFLHIQCKCGKGFCPWGMDGDHGTGNKVFQN